MGHRDGVTWLAASLCQAPLSIGIELRYTKLFCLPCTGWSLNHQAHSKGSCFLRCRKCTPSLSSTTVLLRWVVLCCAVLCCTMLCGAVLCQVWELPARLLEIGGVYESFGSFEGALYIYQRIGSSMPTSSGFEYVLFRCAVVMRYMSTLEVCKRSVDKRRSHPVLPRRSGNRCWQRKKAWANLELRYRVDHNAPCKGPGHVRIDPNYCPPVLNAVASPKTWLVPACFLPAANSSFRQRAPRESLLQSALEHLDLIIQEQTLRKGYAAESAALLFADVCMSLAEGSKVAEGWAKTSYKEVWNECTRRGLTAGKHRPK